MKKSQSYPLGKLPAEHLSRLLAQYAPTDPDVIVGPRVGEDAAVLAVTKGFFLVAKSDPITFATDEIGWYAVHVNANDVVCTGARPRWWMATILLPGGKASPSLVDEIFAQMDEACQDVGAQLVGGHTEITSNLDRPIVVGVMLGDVRPHELISTAGARPGDSLILTKGIAVEGTAILAREKTDRLAGLLSAEQVARCADLLHRPGISVVRDAQIAVKVAGDGIHALHDPTEGGIATGLHEMAEASGNGLEVFGSELPVFTETRLICDALGLDPLGLIASGSLLMAVSPISTGAILHGLAAEGIAATVIGRVLGPGEGRMMVQDGEKMSLPSFSRDELARFFESQ